MKKIVLISGHDAQAKRRTGFHFWAQILSQRGHDVSFITVGASYLSLIKNNKKDLIPPYNQWVQLEPNLKKFTWLPPIHPVFVKAEWLDKILSPLFRLYPYFLPKIILREIRNADTYIIENGAGVMLMPQLIKNSPNAKFIYNASDRLGMLDFHPIIVAKNREYSKNFSLIRLNAEDLSQDFENSHRVLYVPQGIDKKAFDKQNENPYLSRLNAISVGDTLFDPAPIETLAEHYPEWNFHLFGKNSTLDKKFKNVIEHGETPFDMIIPYLQYANVGLATYQPHPDANYLAQSSLKTTQYTYCQLPILSPSFLKINKEHIFTYEQRDKNSIYHAFEAMQIFDRSKISKDQVLDWNDVIDTILENA